MIMQVELTKKQKYQLASLALHVLYDEERKFDMQHFAMDENDVEVYPDSVHECGTSCCLLGYAPVIFEEYRISEIAWDDIELSLTGSFDEEGWDCLFDTDYPNDRKQAAARINRFLTTDDRDPENYYDLVFNDSVVESLKQIQEENKDYDREDA